MRLAIVNGIGALFDFSGNDNQRLTDKFINASKR